jgi:hypothetical protein
MQYAHELAIYSVYGGQYPPIPTVSGSQGQTSK